MNRLRPINSEFTEFYPSPIGSTELYGKWITWRVIGHVRVCRFAGDKIGVLREEVKAINIRPESHEEMEKRVSTEFYQEEGSDA